MENGVALFRKVAPHTYRDWLKVVAKTVAKNAHQNQTIIIEIVKDGYLDTYYVASRVVRDP